MNTVIRILLIWMMTINIVADTKKMTKHNPDFRYPQTVSHNAQKAYDEAIKAKDYNMALQALIQYALAETLRTDSAMTDVMAKCETLYQRSDKTEYKVMVDHLRSRLYMNYAYQHYLNKADYLREARKFHENAKQLAKDVELPAQQLGENLLRADEWGWRIIPTLSDFLKQWEYENHQQLGLTYIADVEYLKTWRSMQSDIATEMYLEYKLTEMQHGEEQYAAYKRYETTYPESPYLASCRNRIAEMEREDVRIVYDNTLSSHAEIEVNISLDNLHDCDLTLYRIPEEIAMAENRSYNVKDLKAVAETHVHIEEGVIPFYGKDAVARFKPQGYGKYVILPSFTDKYGNHCAQEKITLYRWENMILTVTDLAAYVLKDGRGYKVVAVDRTTGEPQKDVTIEKIENLYRLTRGADRYSNPETVYESDYSLPKSRTEVNLYTDLKIYRPGESLRGTAIAYQCSAEVRKPLAGKSCTVSLRDANNEEVESQTSTFDEMGQVTFSFDIPTDRMNGRWSLSCETEGNGRYDGKGYTWVDVSEYKLPTFSIDLSETPSIQQNGKNGSVRGKAMTFTGMPVADAEVELTLNRHTWWWWRRNDDTFRQQRMTVRTDTQGAFSFDCPAEWFTIGDNDCYIYQAQVSCTNKAGERHDASCSFTVGKAEGLLLTEGDLLLPADGKIMLPAQYQTSEKEPKPTLCHYRLASLADTTQTVKEGDVMSNDMHVDWSDVPSGQYQLKASVNGTDSEARLTLYRETDKTSASDKQLWIPEPTRRVSKDGKTTDILIGVRKECYIYYAVESRTKVEKVKSQWLHYKPGMHHLRLPMPKGTDNYLNIQLATMLEGQTYTENLRVDCPRQERLHLVATTFRDKSVPGTGETWRFRLTDQDGKPVKSARVILEAYNKALKQLAANNWHFNAGYLTANLCDLQTKSYGNNYASISGTPKFLKENHPMLPQLWLYGIDFFGSRHFMGHRMLASMASPAMMKNEMVTDDMDMSMNVESAPEAEEITAQEESNLGTRSGDLHVALWEPRLTSDKDGNVEVVFNVPQQNATWVVQALAYSNAMTTERWEGEVLVQRPLMVQPVLPRFVRQGDHVVLKTQVMNATDSDQQAHVTIEIYDPRTNATVKTADKVIQLTAKGTQVVQIACDVPNDVPYIGVRIKAIAPDGSSDGEQQLLPVASNAQPVVETYPFYLQPDEPAFDKVLVAPGGKTPDKLILEYSSNPTWYCVNALPSMIDEEARTSIAIAHSLFAIILADRIQKDSTSHQALYDKLTDRLLSLQKTDGGFAWIDYENCTSSEWATNTVMELIGELYHLGCLTEEHKLMQMARQGIAFMEHKAMERDAKIAEVKATDYSEFLSFAYIRNMFDKAYPIAEPKVLAILDKTVKSLTETWGRFSLTDKAFIAMTLNRMGRGDVARNVVESLRQFAITTPAKGMYWERLQDGFWFHPVAATSTILQAMAEVDPRTDELNRIRQWLLLEKQTSDWGSSSLTSDAVYALLTTGDDWLRGDDPGYMRKELPVDTHNVHIDHEVGSPAWGAIYWEYVAPVTEIHEVSLPEVSIHKSLMVQDQDGNWIPATTLKVGQRVQVRLDVHADKALEYVTINDERPAMLEPVDQTSHYEWNMGDGYFHETKDRQTILYVHRLRAGDHRFSYECDVTHSGTFSSGIATIQSHYAPQFTAHTPGSTITTQ